MHFRFRLAFLLLTLVAFGLLAVSMSQAQPEPGEKKKEKKDFDPKGKGGPPKFELGRVLPPFLRDELELTEEQARKIEQLEKSVKQKLESILTPEQLQKVKDFRPKGPKGPKGPPDGDDARKDKGKKPRPDGDEAAPKAKDKKGPLTLERSALKGGIAWFATWESGRREAERSGRLILLVSAAPHCAGVSGVW